MNRCMIMPIARKMSSQWRVCYLCGSGTHKNYVESKNLLAWRQKKRIQAVNSWGDVIKLWEEEIEWEDIAWTGVQTIELALSPDRIGTKKFVRFFQCGREASYSLVGKEENIFWLLQMTISTHTRSTVPMASSRGWRVLKAFVEVMTRCSASKFAANIGGRRRRR